MNIRQIVIEITGFISLCALLYLFAMGLYAFEPEINQFANAGNMNNEANQ